jgi:hypothetical protein
VSLSGLGIVRAAPEPAADSAVAIRRVRFELYCEQMRLATPALAPPKDPGGDPPPDSGAGGGAEPPAAGPSPILPAGERFPRPIVPPDILRPGP